MSHKNGLFKIQESDGAGERCETIEQGLMDETIIFQYDQPTENIAVAILCPLVIIYHYEILQ